MISLETANELRENRKKFLDADKEIDAKFPTDSKLLSLAEDYIYARDRYHTTIEKAEAELGLRYGSYHIDSIDSIDFP